MKRLIAAAALGALLMAAVPSAAWAAETTFATGDLEAQVANVRTPGELSEDAAYQAWAQGFTADWSADYLQAPYAWLGTTYCPQQRSYWCGPAAVQTALTNFGLHPSQSTMAARLGTTSSGTAVSRIDDVLRAWTGRSYAYHAVSGSSDFYGHVQYSLLTKRRPLIVDVRIRPPWGPYRYAHSGHIICSDGFSWATSIIRLNDSYNEASWISGGGVTGAHTNYARSTLFAGVWSHAGHPIVY